MLLGLPRAIGDEANPVPSPGGCRVSTRRAAEQAARGTCRAGCGLPPPTARQRATQRSAERRDVGLEAGMGPRHSVCKGAVPKLHEGLGRCAQGARYGLGGPNVRAQLWAGRVDAVDEGAVEVEDDGVKPHGRTRLSRLLSVPLRAQRCDAEDYGEGLAVDHHAPDGGDVHVRRDGVVLVAPVALQRPQVCVAGQLDLVAAGGVFVRREDDVQRGAVGDVEVLQSQQVSRRRARRR